MESCRVQTLQSTDMNSRDSVCLSVHLSPCRPLPELHREYHITEQTLSRPDCVRFIRWRVLRLQVMTDWRSLVFLTLLLRWWLIGGPYSWLMSQGETKALRQLHTPTQQGAEEWSHTGLLRVGPSV